MPDLNSDDDLFTTPPKSRKPAEKPSKPAAAKQPKRHVKEPADSRRHRSESPEVVPELDEGDQRDLASHPIPNSVQIAAEEFKARPNQATAIQQGPEEPLELRSAPGGW